MSDLGKVIGVGHCTVDIICPFGSFPALDRKTEIDRLEIQGGGPAANAMAALAKLGVRTAIVSRMGTDIFGQFARRDLLRRDIECTHLFMDRETRSPLSVVIACKEDATRTIVVYKGENREVEPAWLEPEWIATGAYLHIDGHQLPASLKLAKEFKQTGRPIMFDAGSWRDGTEELLSLADTVIASRDFASRLSSDPKEALVRLAGYGAKFCAITLGADGCIGRDADGAIVESRGFAVEARDTTGAGDVFHGAYIYAELSGYEFVERLEFANAAAAMKCRELGARGGLPAADEVREFIERSGRS
ncbi:MAG: hypothetical protein HRF49_11050 [bacterium]